MKVFLSYALAPFESSLAARLRAVALAYDVELLLPNTDNRNFLPLENKRKIKNCDAVIILITNNALWVDSVNLELAEAIKQKKTIIALVENANQIQGLPSNQVIVFNRYNPTQHENQLFEALQQIKSNKRTSEILTTVGAIGLVALGFLALGELAKETNGKK
jgi:hypothetical protein